MMISAVVLITVVRERVNEVGQELAKKQGVTEVFSVAGRWDLVAILRAGSNEEIADLVTRAIRGTPGVVGTETLPAFETFSTYDLKRIFRSELDEPGSRPS